MENNLLFHRLIWQPGEKMHPDWWHSLGLSSWLPAYANMPPPAKRALNMEIQRRCSNQEAATVAPKILTTLQKTLLCTLDRLPTLLLALGLSLSQCPDYLVWRPYRQALALWLTDEQISQLWGMWRGGARMPNVEPDNLINFSQQLGLSVLSQNLSADPVWQVIRFTLPRVSTNEIFTDESVLNHFLRLERFL